MTTTPLLWLVLAGPVALLALNLLPASSPKRLAGVARSAALINLGGAAITALLVALGGSLATPALPGIGSVGGILFDALTAVMFLLVSFVGSIVVHYSRNYMAGDPGHARFTRLLAFTLASVLLLILSGNMALFFAAWVATSLGLNQLLVFYADRPAAILAARKKFIASRLSDACLGLAMGLIWQATGALDFTAVFAALEGVAASGEMPTGLTVAAVLIAVAALLKSAQFPMHGWITEVMETPTPVSALLHAGIINAGGFLALRFSPLLTLSAPSLDLLLIVGGFTALFASVVMLTQNSIKVALAWSTIAQMGFMLLQCGLGAWAPALLHIVAHSLYKAHAFLSSGSVVDIARASWSPSPGGAPHPARLGLAVAGVLAGVGIVGTVSGFELAREPGVFALGAIVLMGLTHYIAQSIDTRPTGFVIARTLVGAAAVAGLWFALQSGMAMLMAGALPEDAYRTDLVAWAAIVAVVASFAALTIGQASFITAKPSGTMPAWARAFYVHAHHGLYVNALANRLVLRLWPTRLPARR
ncbi:NADH-quinone oxidoreductase subunit L [Sandarakinorhabdus sp.]|uniref:NADH-quinone oxidoreductase subunit L n=1 Tax=Sandarakinorhabdus sp. TaxID=1916663 RepID=UPI00286D9B25|nr:NADH-quinone oxidoreductase subunit L [Sandarakinorhabdus sp.]